VKTIKIKAKCQFLLADIAQNHHFALLLIHILFNDALSNANSRIICERWVGKDTEGIGRGSL